MDTDYIITSNPSIRSSLTNKENIHIMTNPNKLGLVIAALMGLLHLVWAILVAADWAQPLVNFIFWAHMIRPIYIIGPFDPLAATLLVVITLFWGYILGFIGGVVWNKLHRQNLLP